MPRQARAGRPGGQGGVRLPTYELRRATHGPQRIPRTSEPWVVEGEDDGRGGYKNVRAPAGETCGGTGASGRASMSRIPGRKYAASVTAPPTRAAPTSVARAPTAPATGAVSAKEIGSRPIEISQSRLETRPSIEIGT